MLRFLIDDRTYLSMNFRKKLYGYGHTYDNTLTVQLVDLQLIEWRNGASRE